MIKQKTRNRIMRIICDCFADETRQQVDCVLIHSKMKIPHKDLVHILKVLESMGYITFEEKTPPHGFIRITPPGKCYFEVRQDKKVEFIQKSILTPIAVSFLTTLALYLLQNWLMPKLVLVLSNLNF